MLKIGYLWIVVQCILSSTSFSMTLQTEILSTETLDFLKQINSIYSFNSVLYLQRFYFIFILSSNLICHIQKTLIATVFVAKDFAVKSNLLLYRNLIHVWTRLKHE